MYTRICDFLTVGSVDLPLPLEECDEPDVSLSPSRDSPALEEGWQQAAHDFTMALGDHSYISCHDHSTL